MNKYILDKVKIVFGVVFLLGVGYFGNEFFDRPQPVDFYTESGAVSFGVSDKSMAFSQSASVRMEEGVVADDVGSDRKVVRNASMSMVVDDVQKRMSEIEKRVLARKGFVVNSSFNKLDIAPTGYVSVRVPSDALEAMIDEIRMLGDVQHTDVSGRDVTDEYVDIEAQLKNAKAGEEALLGLMQRAGSVGDILQVQRELINMRSTIERLEGRIRLLDQTIDLSLLTVRMSTDPALLPTIDEQDAWKPLVTFKEAVRGLVGFGKWVGDMVIWAVVFLPLIVIVLGLWWVYRKRRV